ncbi:hypothetical protein ACVNIS_02755 [Sphaerotilaceae bacterium SBD11-9]
MKHRASIAGLAAAACAFLSGCAADRVNGLKAASPGPTKTAEVVSGACPFSITSIVDLREEKGLGLVHLTRVDGDSFSTWFADGLRAIPGHAQQGAPATMQVEVLRAYIHSLSTMKSANLVLRVHLATSGASTSLTKVYRGVDRSLNWSSSESEIQAAFDGAMAHLQQQLAEDLALTCRQ